MDERARRLIALNFLGFTPWRERDDDILAPLRKQIAQWRLQPRPKAAPAVVVTPNSLKPEPQPKPRPRRLQPSPKPQDVNAIFRHRNFVASCDSEGILWVLPPLRPIAPGVWASFAREEEQILWAKALTSVGLSARVEVFLYRSQRGELPPNNLENLEDLPWSSARKIAVVGFWARHILARWHPDISAGFLHWQDREIPVICLTHPNDCLLDPQHKYRLWQDLVNLS